MKPGIIQIVFAVICLVSFDASASLPAGVSTVDSLVMVANKKNPAVSINKSDAKKLLLGQTTSWSNGAPVVVVLRGAGNADRSAVLKQICGMSEAEYTRHNLQASFMGATVASIVEASSAAAVRNYVRNNPGAVGFLHKSDVDDNVKAVWTVE